MAIILSDINHFLNIWEEHGFELKSMSDIFRLDSFFFRLGINKTLITKIAIEALNYQVLLCSTAPTLMAARKARRRGFRGTIVFDDFGVWPWQGFATGLWGPLGALFPLWAKANIKQNLDSINIVLTPSNFQKRNAVKEYSLDPRKITVAPYPIPSIFNPSASKGTIRRDNRIQEDDFLVLYAGRLNPTKHIETIIEATYLLRKNLPIKLLVVGRDQGSKRKLTHLVNKRALKKQVIFVDQVEYEKMPEFYCSCDVVATASLYETYCYPVAEAYACGRTVVASNCTAIPEVVENAGILCSPNNPAEFSDALFTLWKNPALKKKLERKALERSMQTNKNTQKTISKIAKTLHKG